MRNRRSQFSAISTVFPQILVDFQPIRIDCRPFSGNFNQFQSILVSFNQFDCVNNAGIYWQPEGDENNT